MSSPRAGEAYDAVDFSFLDVDGYVLDGVDFRGFLMEGFGCFGDSDHG